MNLKAYGSLRVGLGVLWLSDALLQAQPGLFSVAFYGRLPGRAMESLVQQTADSQPPWLERLMYGGLAFWGQAPVLFNSFAIATQIFIGVCLLARREGPLLRWGVIVSLAWSVTVWVFGEGLGGLFSGRFSYFTGAPGSAILYTLAGLLLLGNHRLGSAPLYGRYLRVFLCLYFVWMMTIQALPGGGWWNAADLAALFGNAAADLPAILAGLPQALALLAITAPGFANTLLIVVLLWMVSSLACMGKFPRMAVSAGLAVLFLSWWAVFAFGDIASGLATDWNTPPVLGLLLVVVYLGVKEEGESRVG